MLKEQELLARSLSSEESIEKRTILSASNVDDPSVVADEFDVNIIGRSNYEEMESLFACTPRLNNSNVESRDDLLEDDLQLTIDTSSGAEYSKASCEDSKVVTTPLSLGCRGVNSQFENSFSNNVEILNDMEVINFCSTPQNIAKPFVKMEIAQDYDETVIFDGTEFIENTDSVSYPADNNYSCSSDLSIIQSIKFESESSTLNINSCIISDSVDLNSRNHKKPIIHDPIISNSNRCVPSEDIILEDTASSVSSLVISNVHTLNSDHDMKRSPIKCMLNSDLKSSPEKCPLIYDIKSSPQKCTFNSDLKHSPIKSVHHNITNEVVDLESDDESDIEVLEEKIEKISESTITLKLVLPEILKNKSIESIAKDYVLLDTITGMELEVNINNLCRLSSSGGTVKIREKRQTFVAKPVIEMIEDDDIQMLPDNHDRSASRNIDRYLRKISKHGSSKPTIAVVKPLSWPVISDEILMNNDKDEILIIDDNSENKKR